jgi:hypothetical protein
MAMSLADVLPSVRELSRAEKLQLIQMLAADLAQAEGGAALTPGQTYPVWSPFAAHEAAAVLLGLLDADRKSS